MKNTKKKMDKKKLGRMASKMFSARASD